VWSAHALLKRTGQQSNVLNIDPRAPESDAYIRISGAFDFGTQVLRHVWDDWTLNVHTNGHNRKSWTIAAACGFAAQFGPGATLTLHSGMAPSYIRTAPGWMRRLIRLACVLHRQVICVNAEIADAISELGVARTQLEIVPAFLPIELPEVTVPAEIDEWMHRHSPVLSSTMFFRPEYGFELLVEAVSRLRTQHPECGCLVMGTGEDREAAAQLVASRGLTDAMYLAGDLEHQMCLALMGRSNVFVRPTFRDGDSISVREAVALGVPVVASNVGTRPEEVRVFEAGDVNGLVRAVESVLERDKAA
jgi:glycosyltransferase involved in cell wall biosynthesis